MKKRKTIIIIFGLLFLFWLCVHIIEPWIDAKIHPVPSVRHIINLDGRKYHLYWGDLHGHSGLSPDAFYYTPDHFYRYGREVAKLDFAALTDHDAPWGLARNPEWWEKVKTAAAQHYEPGRFVTFIAFEWTSGSGLDKFLHTLMRRNKWAFQNDPAHFGHRNVYFPTDQAPDHVFSNDDPRYDTPEKLWAAMKPYGAISIPHHPLGGPVYPFIWDRYSEEFEPVVEIYSYHGNSECDGCPAEIYSSYRNGRHSVRAPLDDGKHFGFIASTDCHQGRAGNYTAPYYLIDFLRMFYRGKRVPGQGTAAVYAEELTRESIFNALRARRVYATTGARIILDVRANDIFMGNRLHAGSNPVIITIYAKTLLPISRIEIIKNGRTIKTFKELNETVSLKYKDVDREKAEDYIYIRLTQRDSHMAWSSPVWIAE